MSFVGEKTLLRVYLQSADRPPHVPTYDMIVQAARRHKLAGATVLRGILGYGHHGMTGHSRWALVQHEPIIVEIVDSAEAIAGFIAGPLDQIMHNGMLTLERAAVALYRARGPGGKQRPDQNLADQRLCAAGPVPDLSTIPKIQPGPHMTTNQTGVLLRVFIGESDRFEHTTLYQAIVQKARELGLAGATVLRGSEGFGASSVVHKSSLLDMSSDLPIVIEIVDSQEKMDLLLPHLQTMVSEGMITMEYVVILMYRHDPADAPGPK